MAKIIQLADSSGDVYTSEPHKTGSVTWASEFAGSTAAMTFHRIGNIVEVTANFQNANAINASTDIGTIPTGFTPSINIRINGLAFSTGSRWQIEFSTLGNGSGIRMSPIGGDTINANQYIRFQTSWYTNTAFPS